MALAQKVQAISRNPSGIMKHISTNRIHSPKKKFPQPGGPGNRYETRQKEQRIELLKQGKPSWVCSNCKMHPAPGYFNPRIDFTRHHRPASLFYLPEQRKSE
jgi:hypothetical protein